MKSLTFSNRLELLFEALSPHLFADPFAKPLIIVPSPPMKSWVMQQTAFLHEIAFGFEVKVLNEALRKLAPASLTSVELAIRIENKSPEMGAKMALELAGLFLKYGEYYENEMQLPKEQAELWSATTEPLYLLLKNPPKVSSPIHLFGFSYLPPVKQKFFEKLKAHFWILSPSRMLWTEERSEKESYFFTSLLQKRGVKFSHLEELHAYLEESNPLIGNNGRLGRKWRERVDAIAPIAEEIYGVAASDDQELIDGVISYPSSQLTLLEAVQSDLALLTTRKRQMDLEDRSIQIHEAPSLHREIEALYDALLQACASGIQPKEILVMAPSIEKYVPFIKAVFKKIPFEILERTSILESPHVRLFFSLMELSESRWEITQVFEILETCKTKLRKEELPLLKTLLYDKGVRWGLTRAHREKLCGNPLADPSNRGSWEGGIQRLIEGTLSPTQEELLSSFLEVFEKLQQDLQVLVNPILRTIEEWKSILNHLVDTYIEEEQEELRTLMKKLSGQGILSFKSLFVYLKALAEESFPKSLTKNLQAVRFCPLLPMRAIPASIIALLGLNQSIFPRIERKNPLHLVESKTYIPSLTDLDRYLFLESLLSARKQWILSYLNSDTEIPSPLIQELLHYLDASYRIGDKKPSEVLVVRHAHLPLQSFVAKLEFAQIPPPLPLESMDLTLIPRHLTLKQLNQLLFNPIKYHLNHVYGIYFQDEPPHPHMEEFIGEKLWEADWLKWVLWDSSEKLFQVVEEKLPLAPFKQPALERLKQKMEEYRAQFLEHEEIFEIEFSYACKKLEQIAPHSWQAPAIEIVFQDRPISLTGLLPYVTKNGLLSLRDFSPITLAEILFLKELPKGFVEPQVLFVKNKNKSLTTNIPWQALLEHFLRSLHQPTPHIPSWVPALLTRDPEKLFESMQSSSCAYFQWAFPEIEKIDCQKVIDQWSQTTQHLFGALYENV